ncbi:hypothetical protein JFL43_16015 [Viridibacillus sp. YIM B01967]|uniref:Uncharacterized protein n=1 Tax=Viridibacillus soli TaxID=2798301 RepID=A0ABS1HA99_9BACL|nr:hypothetical protein [Viridibacillus soli]MBK3496337.1 hypothetical protein [Viridibacillus soli]
MKKFIYLFVSALPIMSLSEIIKGVLLTFSYQLGEDSMEMNSLLQMAVPALLIAIVLSVVFKLKLGQTAKNAEQA